MSSAAGLQVSHLMNRSLLPLRCWTVCRPWLPPPPDMHACAEYKGHAHEDNVKEILMQDMDGMFARCYLACACALCRCEGKLSGYNGQ